jgi:hypothetical protein
MDKKMAAKKENRAKRANAATMRRPHNDAAAAAAALLVLLLLGGLALVVQKFKFCSRLAKENFPYGAFLTSSAISAPSNKVLDTYIENESAKKAH